MGKRKIVGGKNIDCTSKINDLVDLFGDPGPPIVVDNKPCGLRYYYHFPRAICIETTPEGNIASVIQSRS
jgi:hypothetical protein